MRPSALVLAACLCACSPAPAPQPPLLTSTPPLPPAPHGGLVDVIAVPRCAPTGGTHSVDEGQRLDVVIACTSGVTVPPGGLTLTGLPAGAVYDDVTGHLVYTPGLDAAAVTPVTVTVMISGETSTLLLAVVDAFDAPGNVPPLDPLRYPEENGLPVLFVSPRPSGEVYVPTDVVYRGRGYGAEAKQRGAFSRSYPKNSFTIDFDDRFSDGPFVARSKLVVTSTFDDNAYVRQRMSFAAWNRLADSAPAGHARIEHQSVVVYIDGEYEGLFALTDQVNRDLFQHGLGLPDEGNLYKSVDHNANFSATRAFSGDPKASLREGWETRDEPDVPVDAWLDFEALMRFVTTSSDLELDAELAAHVDPGDLTDWWVFATAIVGEDSYGKNAYVYKPSPAEPFRTAPWDFNHSFGQAWETSRTSPASAVDEGWPLTANLLWSRMLASPVWGPSMRARYAAALQGPLHVDVVLADWDAAVAEVEVAARRDARKWEGQYGSFYSAMGRTDLLTVDAEQAYGRQWIVDRWAGLAAQFPPP